MVKISDKKICKKFLGLGCCDKTVSENDFNCNVLSNGFIVAYLEFNSKLHKENSFHNYGAGVVASKIVVDYFRAYKPRQKIGNSNDFGFYMSSL